MTRVFNFSAGPAVLPEPVLQQAAAEMLDWHGSGMSVMEMSHRGKEFIAIHALAEADLRELMAIPKNYKVLFLQGGASAQFAMVPLNLLRGKKSADYVNTGEWSKKAIKEAKKFGGVNVAATSEATKHRAAAKRLEDHEVSELRAPALEAPAALPEIVRESGLALVAGDALTVFAEVWADLAVDVCPAARAGAAEIARLARIDFLRGRAVRAAEAMPIYVRDRVALTIDERRSKVSA